MERDLFIGLDFGTTAIKLLCLAQDGTIVFSDSLTHDLLTTNEGFAEESPDVWERHTYALFKTLVTALSPKDLASVKAIRVTGMVPTLIPLDAEYQPLGNSIQQQDNRAIVEVEQMQQDFDPEWVFEHTGSMVNSQHIGPKLIWLKKHKPNLFSQMRFILGSYDYIRYILSGSVAIERNWALESGMWDLRRGVWIDEILSYCSIDTTYLGEVKKYYGKIGVCELILRTAGLQKGQKILFYGQKTPAEFFIVEQMQIEHDPVEKAEKGTLVAIKVPFRVRKNDKVFLWEESKEQKISDQESRYA